MARSDALWSDAELSSLRQMGKIYAERQRDVAFAAQSLVDQVSLAVQDSQEALETAARFSATAIARDSLDAFLRPSLDAEKMLAASVRLDLGATEAAKLNAFTYPSLGLREWAVDSVFADQVARRQEMLEASVRSIVDAQWDIANSVFADQVARQQEMLEATRSSLLYRPKEREAPFDNLGAAYLRAPEVALQMPAVDPPRPIVPPTRRAQRSEVVLVGVAAPDSAELLVESLIARREVAADPFLYECLTDVRHWLRVGRPRSAVDRAHSAVHRMLQIMALEVEWEFNRRDGVLDLYRHVRKHHPAFAASGGEEKVLGLFGSLGQILQKITEIRNQHSLAHPSRGLISEPSARFVVHMALAAFELMADRDEAAQPDA